MKHTPKPWKVHKPGEYSPTVLSYTITGGVSPDPVTNARYLKLADVYKTRHPNPMWRQEEEVEANAYLMAASPYLLEECKRLMDSVYRLLEWLPPDLRHMAQLTFAVPMDRAKQAIDRATRK